MLLQKISFSNRGCSSFFANTKEPRTSFQDTVFGELFDKKFLFSFLFCFNFCFVFISILHVLAKFN